MSFKVNTVELKSLSTPTGMAVKHLLEHRSKEEIKDALMKVVIQTVELTLEGHILPSLCLMIGCESLRGIVEREESEDPLSEIGDDFNKEIMDHITTMKKMCEDRVKSKNSEMN